MNIDAYSLVGKTIIFVIEKDEKRGICRQTVIATIGTVVLIDDWGLIIYTANPFGIVGDYVIGLVSELTVYGNQIKIGIDIERDGEIYRSDATGNILEFR